MNSSKDRNSADWVHQLHNRSWEMELLIVGFALLVLLRVPELLMQRITMIDATIENPVIKAAVPVGFTLVIGSYIMMINLSIHLVLRGYWIGIVGLNSAFPNGVALEKLKFQSKFHAYLQNRLENLDHTAVQIDRICSAIFAFSFLLIFIFLSIALYFISFVILISPVSFIPDSMNTLTSIYAFSLLIIYLFLGLLLAIDFLSLGVLKKIKTKWFSLPYYYVSSYFRFVTGFKFYQSIYYTLISNIPRWLITSILAIYILGSLGLMITHYDDMIYFPRKIESKYLITPTHYLETIDNDSYITEPVISNKIVDSGYLELFIPYSIDENDSLKKYCDGILPLKNKGFSWGIGVRVDTTEYLSDQHSVSSQNMQAILDCICKVYEISIDDSVLQNIDFLYYKHPHLQEPGFLAVIQTSTLRTGMHHLMLRRMYQFESAHERLANTYHIPFWVVRE